jgi:hypothetical protein
VANRPARATKAELTTALGAAVAAGFTPSGYEIEGNGTIRVLFGESQSPQTSTLEERAEASAQARRLARGRG